MWQVKQTLASQPTPSAILTWSRIALLGVLALCATLYFDGQTSVARAGHQYLNDSAHCANSSGSGLKLCRTNWQGANTTMNIRAVDDYSSIAPWLTSAVTAAVNSWYNAPGPIRATFSSQANDSYVWYKTGTNSGPYTSTGIIGITRQCLSSSNCATYFFIGNFQFTEIYLNRSILTQSYVQTSGGTFKAQWVAAHEMGHAVGLDHHPREVPSPCYNLWSSVLMRPCADEGPGVNGPVGWDLGTLISPACAGDGGQKGVRCIYRWTLN